MTPRRGTGESKRRAAGQRSRAAKIHGTTLASVLGHDGPPGASRQHRSRASAQSSDGAHVDGVRALGALLLLIFDLRALGKRLEPASGDRGVVDEEVLAFVVWLDEA